ncbi:hypothetical protein F6455_02460 [Proteobacteria bacterium 005FR1]|nr:hypothetical protein [Proteobacteria bacterium 005FR1]
MKYLFVLFAALLVTACSDSPEESPVTGADETHAHDGAAAHSHEGEADHAHDSTETEVFYGDEAQSPSEVGTVGGPSVTGLEHEHAQSSEHHHDDMEPGEHSHDEHGVEATHQQEGAGHHHDDIGGSHTH